MKCVECQGEVPIRQRTYQYTDGSTGSPAGSRLGSMWMSVHDPAGLFCTMRCAATYAIRTANKRIRGDIPPEK